MVINSFSVVTNKKNYIYKKKKFFKEYSLYYSFDNYTLLCNQTSNSNIKKRFLGSEEIIKYVGSSKKKNILISGSNNNIIKIWDIYSIRSLKTLNFTFDFLENFEMNYNSKILIIIGKNSITIWNIYNFFCLYYIPLFSNVNPSLNFFYNSNIFVTLNFKFRMEKTLIFFGLL